jgi:hypothetical protein
MRNKPRSARISAGFSPRALASSIGHAAFIFFVRDMPHASTIYTLTKSLNIAVWLPAKLD